MSNSTHGSGSLETPVREQTVPSYESLLQDYEDLWADTQDLTPEELLEMDGNEEFHFSVDLSEATYNIPFDVLDSNLDVCDEVMNDFKPWITFHSIFRSHERDVDMSILIEKGLWNGPERLVSTRGSFMGDGMSFIHLTLLLGGLVRSVYQANDIVRPLGQSVGDDLFLLKARLKSCLEFCFLAEQLGCKFSKLNSISPDTVSFCEQYVAKVDDQSTYEELEGFANSIFGDLVFLDNIKGSILSGNAKVQADGRSPFIGHATMLNKLVRWHPIRSTKERSKVFLWASNFMEASRLGSNMASLPICLGGMELAVGTTLLFSDKKFQEDMLPYYESMTRLDLGDFLKYYLLLRGIYKANPKGFTWENDWKVIRTIVDGVAIIEIPNVRTYVPEEIRGKPIMSILKYINNEMNLISFRDLASELARRDSFHKIWNRIKSKDYMTLKISNVRQRVNHAWAIIKSNLDPTEESEIRSTSMTKLVNQFQEKTWGLYVSKDDPAISDMFEGMPTLMMANVQPIVE
jgi:hypothetical protein